VNFVFVRIETCDGLVGWGEAACLGGPTWSEESAESIAATLGRYVVPWLIGRDAAQLEMLRLEMARRVAGNPFARAAVEMALWDLNGRALGVPVHPSRRGWRRRWPSPASPRRPGWAATSVA
jgi:L-alanine-DL-glutamate epimerase-like enolase superfamily enzyme